MERTGGRPRRSPGRRARAERAPGTTGLLIRRRETAIVSVRHVVSVRHLLRMSEHGPITQAAHSVAWAIDHAGLVRIPCLRLTVPCLRPRSPAGLLIAILASSGLLGCGFLPGQAWKVDVVNGDRPLMISITTDQASWAWHVPAHSRMVLLNERGAPTEGQIDLIDPRDSCLVYDTLALPVESFTIHPARVNDAPLDYSLGIVPGATVQAPVNTNYFGGCSG